MKAFWKGSVAYSVANALTAGAQFTSVIIFSGALRSNDFGQLSIFTVLYVVLSMVGGLGLSAAAQRSYFQISFIKFQVLVSTIIKAIFIFSIFIALLIAFIPDYFINYLSLPRSWILYALIASTAQVLVQILLTLFQIQEKIPNYLRIVALQVAVHVSCSIGFLLTPQKGWQLAVLAQSAAPIVTGSAALLILLKLRFLTRQGSMALLSNALRYSLPLVPHQLAGWVISMVDRFIIATYLGISQAGVYSLSFQISQATNIVSNSVNQALVPVMFRMLAEEQIDGPKLRYHNTMYAAGLGVFSVLFILIFLAVSPFILRSDYILARSYTPWLIVAFLFLSLSRISSNFLMYYGKTGVLSISTIIAALFSLSLNLAFIREYGVIGACWASVAAFALLFSITTWRAILCYRQRQ